MKNISNIKKRILDHLDVAGISKNKFYIKTGISNGVLDKETGVSEMVIEKYISNYPEINPEWLVTGEGEMFRKDKKGSPKEDTSFITYAPDFVDTLKKLIESQDRIIHMYEGKVSGLEKKIDELEKEKTQLQEKINQLSSKVNMNS